MDFTAFLILPQLETDTHIYCPSCDDYSEFNPNSPLTCRDCGDEFVQLYRGYGCGHNALSKTDADDGDREIDCPKCMHRARERS